MDGAPYNQQHHPYIGEASKVMKSRAIEPTV
jgi:hypothetical protein